jgi:hypothetical protein
MCCIIAVTPHRHHTGVVHGAALMLGVPIVMFVSCGGGIMNMIPHVMLIIHLQHIQVHLYLI